jgi:hypothetical protein
MQSRACLQFGHAASIRNRLRRANGAIQASSLQSLPGAPAANLSRLTPRQSASSHNLYAPDTILNLALTPAPDTGALGASGRDAVKQVTSVPHTGTAARARLAIAIGLGVISIPEASSSPLPSSRSQAPQVSVLGNSVSSLD